MAATSRARLARKLQAHPEHLKLLEEAYSSGSWIQIPKPFFSIMTLEEAVFLSFLRFHAKRVRNDVAGFGWFYCRINDIKKVLQISTNTQTRLMNKLQSRGYLKTKWQQGIVPAKRLIWICWDKIASDLYDSYDERNAEEKTSRKSELNLLREMEGLEPEDEQ